jgi:hypothetical protein
VVGHNFKFPHFPVWVLFFDSHYSVLFSATDLELGVSGTISALPKGGFDLYYYDGLMGHDSLVRLTLVKAKKDTLPDDSSLENCIRCLFSGYAINWNGGERIL